MTEWKKNDIPALLSAKRLFNRMKELFKGSGSGDSEEEVNHALDHIEFALAQAGYTSTEKKRENLHNAYGRIMVGCELIEKSGEFGHIDLATIRHEARKAYDYACKAQNFVETEAEQPRAGLPESAIMFRERKGGVAAEVICQFPDRDGDVKLSVYGKDHHEARRLLMQAVMEAW